MAIHPQIPGFTAEIFVNGQALQEFDDGTEQELNTVVSYVEATAGTYFDVRITVPESCFNTSALRAALALDGWVLGSALGQSGLDGDEHGDWKVVISNTAADIVNGLSVAKAFRFSKLNTDEKEHLDEATISALARPGFGSIELRIRRVTIGLRMPPVQEREALKGATSHSLVTSHGPFYPAPHAPYRPGVDMLEDGNKPLARFVWNYRSRGELDSLDLSARPSSESTLPGGIKAEEGIKAEDIANALIKTENDNVEQRDIQVKRELTDGLVKTEGDADVKQEDGVRIKTESTD
ncbi:hypothetical protein EK21DRAFT_84678 [Setomelanomma holmii]|uniref:DUF7918 domain-containing protein n=1 Tax=Setomelanomma holmii TaxID=210430 RepID=A0A9P4HKF2_9PLEO|nr:hypothetical protein EK21DRAFT_84678 [Setomelanomma holmii]